MNYKKDINSPRILFCIVFSLLAVFILDVQADNSNVIKTAHFEISLPEELSYIVPEIPGALILGKPTLGGFPTINILRSPSKFELQREDKIILSELEDSYHLSGLTDAKAKLHKFSKPNDSRIFTAAINYSNNNKDYTALVCIFGFSDAHYILTLINYTDNNEASIALLEQVLSTVKFFEPEDTKSFTTKDSPTSNIGLYLILFAILLLPVWIIRLRYK